MDATTIAALNSAAKFGVNVTEIAPLGKGRSNLSILVRSKEAKYVLRRYSQAGEAGWHRRLRTKDGILYEHEVAAFAASQGLPCVSPIRSPKGETLVETDGNYYALFPFIESESLPAGTDTTLLAAGLLGRFHRVMQDFPVRTQRPQAGFMPKVAEWFHVSDPALGEVDEIVRWAKSLRPRSDTQKAVARSICYIEEALRVLRDEFPHSAYEEFPVAVNHGDFSRNNLGWRDGSIVAMFDLDNCYLDLRTRDIASVLWKFIWMDNAVFDLNVVRPVIEAYRRECDISCRELALCPYFIAGAYTYMVLEHSGVTRIRPETNLVVSIVLHTEAVKWALSFRERFAKEFARL